MNEPQINYFKIIKYNFFELKSKFIKNIEV